MSDNNYKINIQNNTYSFWSLFEFLQSEGYTITFPELQRPLVWDINKIKGIFAEQGNNYFGNITIMVNGKKLVILDGQQRISSFLCILNSCNLIKVNDLVFAEQLCVEEASSIKIFYSKEFSKYKNEDYCNIRKSIGKYGYIDIYEMLKNEYTQQLKETKLQESFCSLSIIEKNSKIKDHDVFISLNYLGKKLSEIDILKALFLKNLSCGSSPTNITNYWHDITSLFAAKPKNNKFDADFLLVKYISQFKKNIVKKGIIPFYKQKIESEKKLIFDKKSSFTNIDTFIEKEVHNLKNYFSICIGALQYCENKDSISTKLTEYLNTFTKFLLNSKHIYSPLTPIIISYHIEAEKRGADFLKKYISFGLFAMFLAIRNKQIRLNESYGIDPPFIQGNAFRNRIESFFQKNKVNNFGGIKDLFYIFQVNDLNKDKVLDSDDAYVSLAEHIYENIYSEKLRISKNLKILMEWFLLSDENEFFKFRNSVICEHFVETIPNTNQKKKLSIEYINFIEAGINEKMNSEIDKLKKIWKGDNLINAVKEIKLTHYHQSSVLLTNNFAQNYQKTKAEKRMHITNIISNYIKKIFAEFSVNDINIKEYFKEKLGDSN